MVASLKVKPPIPRLDVHGAHIRRTDLSGTSLHGANFAGANATNALFMGADFKDAILTGTILIGANLSDAVNLTVDQLAEAIIDETTILPDYIDRSKLQKLS